MIRTGHQDTVVHFHGLGGSFQRNMTIMSWTVSSQSLYYIQHFKLIGKGKLI